MKSFWKTLIYSASILVFTACAKHEFSEVKPADVPEAQSTPQPSPAPAPAPVAEPDPVVVEPTPVGEPDPVVVVPTPTPAPLPTPVPTPQPTPPPVVVDPPIHIDPIGPSLVWVQVPVGAVSTYDPVTVIYRVLPGTSPLVGIECLVDAKPIACELEGQTLKISSPVAGAHNLQITVIDKNHLEADGRINWTLVDKFQKVKTPLVVAKEDSQADILFVIDNSNSMREEQSNMAERISHFMERVQGLDWKIAIVTTDMINTTNGDGRFLKFPNGAYSISSALSMADAKAYFGKTIQTGVNGDFQEQGIKGTYRAIERAVTPKDKLDANNAAFFRKNAALAVIVISDENESAMGVKNSGPELIKLVKNTWGADKLFKFHSIVTRPGDTVCKKKSSEHSYGAAYAALTTLTGGVLGNICEEDYGNQLTVIGQDVQNTQNTYNLACVPRDLDGNGAPDVKVTSSSGAVVPSFIIQSSQIVFSQAPKSGDYMIEYSCPK